MLIISFFTRLCFTSHSNWPLALCAGLLGIGQNGLLVALPVLVDLSHFSLATWSILLTLGSMLFLPSAAWWGHQCEIRGAKWVVIMALGGYLTSFSLLGAAVFLLSTSLLTPAVGLGLLVLARVIYGLTVSGMVPACQVWSLQRSTATQRMTALSTISSGLSIGRLCGPLIAAGALALNPLAPLWLMALAPLCALLIIGFQSAEPPPESREITGQQISWRLLPCLLCALLLAATINLMQLGLAPRLNDLHALPATAISRHVALLLALAAASTLLAQFTVIRPQRLTPPGLLLTAAALISTGLAAMCLSSVPLLYFGCALAAFGSAMATPGYQLLLNQRLSAGKSAGVIASSHTLGYGLSALLVLPIAHYASEAQLIIAALIMALALLTVSIRLWFSRSFFPVTE